MFDTGVLDIPTLPVFERALAPMRYKALHGGRGGAKSYFAASYVIERAIFDGWRCLCLREVQLTLDQSSKQLIETLITTYKLESLCRIYKTHIDTVSGGCIHFKGMQNYNAANIKSFEGYHLAWWEEAHTASQYSLDILIPTIRTPTPQGTDPELMFTWNPEQPEDPVDMMFRGGEPPEDSIIIQSTWEDNYLMPAVLHKEKNQLYRRDPEKAAWVWGGHYRTVSDAQVLRHKYVVQEFEVDTVNWDGPYQGLDYGFSQDPTAATRSWRHAENLYVEYDAGAVGLELDDTLDYLVARIPDFDKYRTRADNARPESTSHLNKRGGNIVSVEKWPGSIEDGIAHLRSYKQIIIHPRCKGTISNARLYSHKLNDAMDPLPDIVDAHNDYIDSLRYALAPVIRNKGAARVRRL